MKSMDQNHAKLNKITDLTKDNLGLFFGDFFGIFFGATLDGWGSNPG
jgi:hypothetical protein